jgi:hypothetical protein
MPRIVALVSTIIDIPWKDILSALLTFLHSIAHYVGVFLIYLLGQILPMAKFSTELVDPLGYLALLTAFLILVQVAKKVAWIVVLAAWILILVRIVLGLFGY